MAAPALELFPKRPFPIMLAALLDEVFEAAEEG